MALFFMSINSELKNMLLVNAPMTITQSYHVRYRRSNCDMRMQKVIQRKGVRPRTVHDIVHSRATSLALPHFVEFPTIRRSEVLELPHDILHCKFKVHKFSVYN